MIKSLLLSSILLLSGGIVAPSAEAMNFGPGGLMGLMEMSDEDMGRAMMGAILNPATQRQGWANVHQGVSMCHYESGLPMGTYTSINRPIEAIPCND